MHRPCGYAPKGERLHAHVPHGGWETATFLGALTTEGVIAPWAQDEPMTANVFQAWIDQRLVPLLKPKMVVVMDNLSSHTGPGIRRSIEAADCRLVYLPPYSPDLNPIERMYSKFKRLLKSAAARTLEDVYQAMRDAIQCILPSECLNYITDCGHPSATLTCNPL